jgi:hypothetical protein
MKASEIIEKLKTMINQYGDLECVRDDYGDYSIYDIEYVPKHENKIDNRIINEDLFRLN